MQKHIALAAELDHLVRHQRANELGSLEQRLLFSDSSQVQDDMEELKDLLYGSEGSPTVRAQGCANVLCPLPLVCSSVPTHLWLKSKARRRSSEQSYRPPLSAEEHPLERERLLVLFALRHHETLWPQAKVRGDHVAAARVQGSDRTPLGEEFERLCEGPPPGEMDLGLGEMDLVRKVIEPCRSATIDESSCTPGLFENVRESKEWHARRTRGQEEYELVQHRPRIDWLLQQLAQGGLNHGHYPVVKGPNADRPMRNIIVFGIGGVTFSEARMVFEFNQQQRQAGKECTAVLGGDFITNAREFVLEHRF